MTTLYHDIETRSDIDLRKAGVYAYAESRHTQVIVMSWALDDDPINRWYPIRNEPMPASLREAMLDPEVIVCAHNAGFERILEVTAPLRPQKFLPIEVSRALSNIRRWNCTAARAAAAGLPRALENVCRALRLPVQKDMDGRKLMLRMCRPRGLDEHGDPLWFDSNLDLDRLGVYCDSDVEPERILDRALPTLSAMERRVWETTERINDRGVLVDGELLARMMPFVQRAESELNARLNKLTCPLHAGKDSRACEDTASCAMPCGKVPKVSNHQAIRKWLVNQGYEDVDDHEDVDGKFVKGTGIGKDVIGQMLHAFADRVESEDNPLSVEEEVVRDVLLLRREGGKSSTAKYKAIQARSNKDMRARGALMFCGAASTARFSSAGIQLQNMPRAKLIKDILQALTDIEHGHSPEDIDFLHGPPLVVASEALRPTFIAKPNTWLARGDYSQIESRVIAWFANHATKLKAFRDYDTIIGKDEKGKPVRKGADIYRVNASGMSGKNPFELTDEERQEGKVTELACGFGGALNALKSMCKVYGVFYEDAKLIASVSGWRDVNAPIVQFWRDLENAAFNCIRSQPGKRFIINHRNDIWFQRTRVAMALRLPSGRHILYWYPRIEKRTFEWGERDAIMAYGEDTQKHIWRKFAYYGGLFAANITQSFAREPMAHSLVEMEDEGLCPVLSVHDEGICELPKDRYPEATMAAEAVRSIMARERPFMKGLPIAVDASAGPRYLKV